MTQKTVRVKKNLSLLVQSSQAFQTHYSKRELTLGGLQLICKREALCQGDPMLLCQPPSTKPWLEGLRGRAEPTKPHTSVQLDPSRPGCAGNCAWPPSSTSSRGENAHRGQRDARSSHGETEMSKAFCSAQVNTAGLRGCCCSLCEPQPSQRSSSPGFHALSFWSRAIESRAHVHNTAAFIPSPGNTKSDDKESNLSCPLQGRTRHDL